MSAWRIIVAVVVLLLPVAASAAPAGKVIIAQGVDPTTLVVTLDGRKVTTHGTSFAITSGTGRPIASSPFEIDLDFDDPILD